MWRTGRASTPLEDVNRAVKYSEQGGEGEVHSGGEEDAHMQDDIKTIYGEEKDRWKRNKAIKGYKGTALACPVFDDHIEKELAEHIKAQAA